MSDISVFRQPFNGSPDLGQRGGRPLVILHCRHWGALAGEGAQRPVPRHCSKVRKSRAFARSEGLDEYLPGDQLITTHAVGQNLRLVPFCSVRHWPDYTWTLLDEVCLNSHNTPKGIRMQT